MLKNMTRLPSILGVALGDPNSPLTYSGVPHSLFKEFHRFGCLAGVANGYVMKPVDIIRGGIDLHRSLLALRPKRNVLWRYSRSGMETLSKRFQRIEKAMPPHDIVFQIGVGALPVDGVKLAAFVEISIATAIKSEIFAKNYGFTGYGAHMTSEAIEGEMRFLERCSFIWTNSEYTAQGLIAQGVKEERIEIHPPAACIRDPGEIKRDWNKYNILFIGSTWEHKGGKLLLEAFSKVYKANPKAMLNIVGCKPKVNMPGVKVYGYLRKDHPTEVALLESLYRDATIFCMPSFWESTGIVYMEAALWGLPIVMVKGQGREKIFPKSMAIHVDKPNASAITEALVYLMRSPETMASMGMHGRKLVLKKYTWPIVASKILNRINKVVSQ